jgi:hypothetical protein
MRKILISLVAGAALTAAPALATKPNHPDHPAKPAKPAKPNHGTSHKCKVHTVGYNAKGVLVSQALTQTQGTATPTDKSDDRYSGDVTVNVTKANHKAPKGEQTFTLTDAKVSYYDANHDGTADTPAAGDTVRIHGKITKLAKKCDQTGFTQTVSVKKLSFKQAKPVSTAPTT